MMAEKSDRTKMIEESKVDPDEDIMTRGVRGAMRGIALGASKAGDFVKQGVEDLKRGAETTADDIHMLLGTKRGKMKEDYLNEKYPYRSGAPEKKSTPEKKRAGGTVKSSASKRADGVAMRGKTRGRIV